MQVKGNKRYEAKGFFYEYKKNLEGKYGMIIDSFTLQRSFLVVGSDF